MIDTEAGYPKMLMSIISASYDANRHFGMHPSDIIFVPGFEMGGGYGMFGESKISKPLLT